MRLGISMIAITLFVPACGGEPGVTRAEHDALLQRVDAMASRIEELEGELAKRPTPEELSQRSPTRAAALEVLAAPPESDRGPPPSLSVRVTATSVEIDGKVVPDADLLARFREIAKAAPGTRLTLMAEPDASHQSLVHTIDVAREAGLTDVAISARVHGEDAGAGGP